NYTDYQQMPQTQQEMVKRMAALGSEFEPGAQAKYSNTNFILLGYIIERITKATYETELQNRICKRIGLKQTYYGHKIQPEKSEVLSYEWNGEQWDVSVETDMSIPSGAGAIVSTPTDLCTFINALFEGKLMKAETFTEMKKIQDGFGKGILQMPFGNRKAFGHNGSIDAFRSSLGYFEDDGMSFSIISNGRSMPQNDIALGVLSIYYGKPYAIPSFETKKLSEELLSAYLGVYGNKDVGLKITVEKKNGQLVAQADGQDRIVLEYVQGDEFKFDAAKVNIKFNRDDNQLPKSFMLSQGGPAIEFTKEK
ncbi:MAG: serine hydrolase, partial [Chitinophagaceae bacterium]|nr:serine hydrolase [Chitinophagaceae bacterium]